MEGRDLAPLAHPQLIDRRLDEELVVRYLCDSVC